MNKTRVLLIGAGKFGRTWGTACIPACSKEVELAGVVDQDENRRAFFQKTVPVFASVQEAIGSIGIDLAINVTQPEAHLMVNEVLLRSGIPVLCEKPIAESMADAMETGSILRETGGFLMIAENYRYFAPFRAIRQLLVGGTLGQIHRLECHFRHHHPDYSMLYHGRLAHPLLEDVTVHHLDLARYLTGLEPERVFCKEFPAPYSWYGVRPASLSLITQMHGGTVFTYDGTLASPLTTTDWYGHWEIECEGGVIHYADGQMTVYRKDGTVQKSAFDTRVDSRESMLLEACRALREGRPGETDFQDNFLTFRWMMGAVLSSEEGRWVGMDEGYPQDIQ